VKGVFVYEGVPIWGMARIIEVRCADTFKISWAIQCAQRAMDLSFGRRIAPVEDYGIDGSLIPVDRCMAMGTN